MSCNFHRKKPQTFIFLERSLHDMRPELFAKRSWLIPYSKFEAFLTFFGFFINEFKVGKRRLFKTNFDAVLFEVLSLQSIQYDLLQIMA